MALEYSRVLPKHAAQRYSSITVSRIASLQIFYMFGSVPCMDHIVDQAQPAGSSLESLRRSRPRQLRNTLVAVG